MNSQQQQNQSLWMDFVQKKIGSQKKQTNYCVKTTDESLDRAKSLGLKAEKRFPNQQVQRDNLQEVRQVNELKKIKSAELLFSRKYLGNKDQSKSLMVKKLLKIPNFHNQDSQKLIQMKTGNLNHQIKQIQTIFKAENKAKFKKSMPSTSMSDFQLYMTKRDILKEKNQVLDFLRNQYQEEKIKLQRKKAKKQTKTLIMKEKIKKFGGGQKIKAEALNDDENVGQSNRGQEKKSLVMVPHIYQNGGKVGFDVQELLAGFPEVGVINNQGVNVVGQQKKEERKIEIFRPLDDEYFQKRFEDRIFKNNITSSQGFSLKSLFNSSDRRKTTLSQAEFIKKQLGSIQEVAKSTIQNFQLKQKINRQLCYPQISLETIKSQLNSKRSTPIDLQVESEIKTEGKSINWIIRECEGFKKRFNVRKTKSLKKITKAN